MCARSETDVGVATTFVDLAGITRLKCVPARRASALASTGVGMSVLWSASQGNDEFAKPAGLTGPAGDMRLVGDPRAERRLAAAPGWSWMPADQRQQDGSPWPACPRTFATTMEQRLGEVGLSLTVGFELEWTLFRTAEPPAPLHRRSAFGAASFPLLREYFSALIRASETAEIGLEQLHPEHGPGQAEVSLSPTDPLRACDEAVLFKLLASWLAEEQGLRASFSPQPLLDTIGNGQHLHFSLWSGSSNLFAACNGSMDPRGEAFLAGVLEHLSALTGLGVSSPVSFLRLRPSQWSGAYACWGQENREAALRLEGSETRRPEAVNVEWKSVDGSANPYLALGGLLAAGLDGLHRHLTLPPPVLGDPAELSERDRDARGIKALPKSLEEAARSLEQCRTLREALGAFLHGCVVAIRANEARSATNEEALVDDYRFRY